jgi:hypothetical protein
MEAIVIQLEVPSEGSAPRRVFVVREGNGRITAVDDGGEGWAALSRVGIEDCLPSLPIRVSAEECERYLREWGPDSRPWILRQADEICRERKTSLSAETTDWRFEDADDREFAAAVWLVLRERAHSGALEARDGFVARLGRYLLRIDKRGRITVEQWRDANGASLRAIELTDGTASANT